MGVEGDCCLRVVIHREGDLRLMSNGWSLNTEGGRPKMMDIRETITVAIDALRANKLRALLTTLGVVIGSACIVLVVTVALHGQQFVIAHIARICSNCGLA